MAESACLVHSFSYAATLAHESHEDNPLHALTQSISFGRFVTESLEWGKWSSFSHKRYVEEAEKYSKPGSVAQKKAFFEAHYKKIAAAKKAAADALSEQQAINDAAKVLPNGSETEAVQKKEVKGQNSETDLSSGINGTGLNIEDDNEPGRKSCQMDEAAMENLTRVGSLNKSRVEDDEKALEVLVTDGSEQEEDENGLISDKNSDGEMLKRNGSIGKKEEDGEWLKKNGSVGDKDEGRKSLGYRMSENTSALLKTPDVVAEQHSMSSKRSDRIAHGSVKKDVEPVRPKFSFLPMSCLLTRTKAQDQDMMRKKEKPKKKPSKSFWCLCFNPRVLGETETFKNQIKRVEKTTKTPKLLN